MHRRPGNQFFPSVAEDLGLDLAVWKPAYEELHDETMAGIVPGIVERISLSAKTTEVSCSPHDVRISVERHFHKMVSGFEVDPQAVPLLEGLREQGLLLALVSNASDHAEWIFDRLGLREYFDVTVFSHRVRVLKPHPGIYLSAIDQLGIPSSHCAFVGDGQHHELRGAKAMGIATILVDRQLPHSQSARAEADIVVDDLTGVPLALSDLSAPRELLPNHR